jgi:hypothetical protein
MHYYANAWLPARELLNAFIVSSKEIDPSGKILVFEQYLPWKVGRRFQAVDRRY